MPLLFQYGSNTNAERLNSPKRLDGVAIDRGRAETVDEYDLAFNVWSQENGCAASDLISVLGTGRHACGVLYEIACELLYGKDRNGRKTMEQIEGPRYEPKTIRVRTPGRERGGGHHLRSQT